jgi:hypothetical protein
MVWSALAGAISYRPPLLDAIDARHHIRDWWHGLLRQHGRYPCYAVFLVRPSNEDLVHYLIDHGRATLAPRLRCLDYCIE